VINKKLQEENNSGISVTKDCYMNIRVFYFLLLAITLFEKCVIIVRLRNMNNNPLLRNFYNKFFPRISVRRAHSHCYCYGNCPFSEVCLIYKMFGCWFYSRLQVIHYKNATKN
jgi:hypothetical protein